jgi:hypothetical protein
MKRIATLGIFLVLLVAIGAIVVTHAERLDAEIAALAREVRALSEKVAHLEETARAPTMIVQVPSQAPTDTRARTDPSSAAAALNAAAPLNVASSAPAKPATTYADQLAYYHASLQAEHVDANWSRASAIQLRTIFGRVGGGAATIRSVDCRQTICRAELSHDTEQAARDFMDDWMTAPARLEWKGPLTGGVESTDPGGTVHSVFYFAREGNELPEMH